MAIVGEWRYVCLDSGVLCVTGYGTTLMQQLFAGNLGWEQKVHKNCFIEALSYHTFFFVKMDTGTFAVLDAILGHGDGRILLDQVACSGNESRLFDCRHRGVGMHSISCTSAFDAGVVCPGKH